MKVLAILLIFVVALLTIPASEVYSEKAIEPIIKFDKTEYGPLDSGYVEIIYPPADTDPEVQDKLEARIFTSSGNSQPLVLYETKPRFIFGFYQYQYHTNREFFTLLFS